MTGPDTSDPDVEPEDPTREPTERDQAARARGLAAPYLPGGRDPDPEATQRQERRYLLALIGMVVLIVGSGIVVTVLGILAGALGGGR